CVSRTPRAHQCARRRDDKALTSGRGPVDYCDTCLRCPSASEPEAVGGHSTRAIDPEKSRAVTAMGALSEYAQVAGKSHSSRSAFGAIRLPASLSDAARWVVIAVVAYFALRIALALLRGLFGGARR